MNEQQRCGFVALVGAPNSGKSTLMNRLVGAKVSIVTHKVQTTRAIVRGIATEGSTQLVFIDTPGIFKPRRKLDQAMVAAAWGGARDADIVLALLDAAAGITAEAESILAGLAEVAHPAALAINKIDRVRRENLLELSARANALARFEATFMISALTGDGCHELTEWLAAKAPPGPWHFAEDEIIDFPVRQLAAEITREKLFLRLHEELPYESHVETEGWEEKPDGSLRIAQVVYVERDGQKKIVIGKGGQTIKAISQAARKEIAEVLERPVHLFLFVKVRENWSDDPARLRAMGLANDRS